jgi:hypothetical protein
MVAQNLPGLWGKRDDGDLSAFEILLEVEAPVSSHKDLYPAFFRLTQ